MRIQIARTLLTLRKMHGPGNVHRLQHLVSGNIVRPRLSETLMYALNGDTYLMYNTKSHSTKMVKINMDFDTYQNNFTEKQNKC